MIDFPTRADARDLGSQCIKICGEPLRSAMRIRWRHYLQLRLALWIARATLRAIRAGDSQ